MRDVVDEPGPVAARVFAALRAPGAGLLLDLDGTLVDSEPMQRAALRDYFASRGWQVGPETLELFMGRKGEESFATIDGPWRGEDPRRLTEGVIDHVDPLANPPRPISAAATMLQQWRQRGLPISLVTSAMRPWAVQALRLLGAEDLGIAMITAEDTDYGKPAAEPFLRGARALGLTPQHCVAAEDSTPGLAAARAAGVGLRIGVTTSLPAAALHDAGAHAVVADLQPFVPPAPSSQAGG